MYKILITGGSGFIGSHFVDRLISKGYDVHVIDNRAGDPHLSENSNATYHLMDITSTAVIQLIKDINPDYIYHLAAVIGSKDNTQDVKRDATVNIIGTINILEAAHLSKVNKIVFTSSSAVYGVPAYVGIDENHPLCPVSPYGMTKRSAEEFVQLYNRLYDVQYTIFRLSTVYGTRQAAHSDGDMVADLISKYMHHLPIHLKGNGQQSRDFVYIDDVLDVLEMSLLKGNNHIFNIGSGHGTLINELINLLNATFEIHVEPNFDLPAAKSSNERYFDITHALEVLDWSPSFNLAEGILETVHYYKRTLRM